MSENSDGSGPILMASSPLWLSILLAVIAAAPATFAAVYGYQAQSEASALSAESEAASDQIQRDIAELQSELEQQRIHLDQDRLAFEQEIERMDLENRTAQVSIEQQRFEADVQARQDGIIQNYVPNLFSSNPQEVDSALAVIFVLYPNEAKDILARVSESQVDEAASSLVPAIERAESLAQATGDWVVAVSSFQSREAALDHTSNLNSDGIYGATVYLIDEYYTTTIGAFPTKETALSEAIRIRSDLNTGAFVLNINNACPRQVQRDGYVQCFE